MDFLIDENKRSFGRILLQNQRAFVLNNIMRTREMLRYSSSGFKTVFQNIPYMFQVNKPKMPGFVPGGDRVTGIFGFERSGFARLYKEKYPDKSIREILAPEPVIESLMLIGSTGSIGHTQVSDLDYWICVDFKALSPNSCDILNEKCRLICEWAFEKYDVEVHFFILDVDDVKKSRFGRLDEESSGGVMPQLIKEEFYRTALHVAGRMPLWWIVPEGVSKAEYEHISRRLGDILLTTFHPLDFIDLGYPEKPDPVEYLGAAMWQVHKSKKDPFKAALKMMLILEQVETEFTQMLLCDQVKKEVLTADPDQLPVDPYWITIRKALDYAALDEEFEDLVRICAWFKLLGPSEHIGEQKESDFKKTVLNSLYAEWGWKEDKIKDLLNYGFWPFRRKIALGEEVKALLLDLYSRIAAQLRKKYAEEVKVRSESLTRLNAAILARYGDHDTKVDDLPYEIHRYGPVADLTVFFRNNEWRIVLSGEDEVNYIYSSSFLGKVMAWLVHNQLWRHNTRIRLKSSEKPVKSSALLSLLHELTSMFKPLTIQSELKNGLFAKHEGAALVAINMEESNKRRQINTAELIYGTNLGEMIYEPLPLPDLDDAVKCDYLADEILIKRKWSKNDIHLFAPPGPVQNDVIETVGAAFKKAVEMNPVLESAGRKKARLDDALDVAERPAKKTKLDLD